MTTSVRVPVRNRIVFSTALVVLAAIVGIVFAFIGLGDAESAAVAPRAALTGFALLLAAAATVLSVRTLFSGAAYTVLALITFALYIGSVSAEGTLELVLAAFTVVLAIVLLAVSFYVVGDEESTPAEPLTAIESARRVDLAAIGTLMFARVSLAVVVLVIGVIFSIGALQSGVMAAQSLGLTLIVVFLAIASIIVTARSTAAAGLIALAFIAALTAFGGAVWPSEAWFAVTALITAIIAAVGVVAQIGWAKAHG